MISRNLLGTVPGRRAVRQIEGKDTTGGRSHEEHKIVAASGHDPKMVAWLIPLVKRRIQKVSDESLS